MVGMMRAPADPHRPQLGPARPIIGMRRRLMLHQPAVPRSRFAVRTRRPGAGDDPHVIRRRSAPAEGGHRGRGAGGPGLASPPSVVTVTLLEAASSQVARSAGGPGDAASRGPHRCRRLARRRMRILGVDLSSIRSSTGPTSSALDPDVVIVATGSRPPAGADRARTSSSARGTSSVGTPSRPGPRVRRQDREGLSWADGGRRDGRIVTPDRRRKEVTGIGLSRASDLLRGGVG
jgi:hypothetical protein